MVSIKLKGREIPLLDTVMEMKTIQEEVVPLDRLASAIYGRNPDNDQDASLYAGPKHLETLAKMIRILGNAALEEKGEKPDLTDKWIMRAMKPTADAIRGAIDTIMATLDEGMQSEIPEKHSDEPVDAGLEEMEKKKEPD